MILLCRSAGDFVLNLLNPTDDPRRSFADEGAFVSELMNEMPGDVAELGGEILVDEEDVHEMRF